MPARISSPVLVGRSPDLSSLAAALDAAAAGSPRFVVVRGEAGIGKSRLVSEAADAARRGGAQVLVGECLDIGRGGLPYLPIAAALRGLARSVPPEALERLLGPGRRELATIAPELASDGSMPSGNSVAPAPEVAIADVLPSGLAQARLYERMLGLLATLSAASPTVLVVEDVHWIDRATRDLVTFLARNLTTERLAIILTCRSEDLPRGHPILAWLGEIERAQPTTALDLGRLDRDDVEQQLRIIGGDDPAPDVTDRIWRRSEGNPLFVEELFAAGDDGTPGSVIEILLARVARLDNAARALVEAVAVAGRPVSDLLLAEVLDVPEAELDDRLRAAIDEGVLRLEPGDAGYRFRHELLREVVEAGVLPGARRRLHERFAHCLEARPDLADPSPVGASAELAHHFAEAGLVAEAYTHSIRAAEATEAVHAYADAYRHLERALELEARLGAGGNTAPGPVELRRMAANDADLSGEYLRAMELTREALAMIDPSADRVGAGLLNSRIGYLQWSIGDSASALDAHREAVRLVPADPPTPERARVLGALGGALMGAGHWAASREVCREAIACAAAAGAPAEESRARNMLGSDLVALGAIDEGIAELREACRLAERSGSAEVLIVGYYNLGLNLATADQLVDALVAAEAGREAARSAGLERRFGQSLAALAGDILLRLGNVDRALDVLSAGLALAPRGAAVVYLSAVRARVAGIRGDISDVERRLANLDLPTLDPDVAAFVAAVLAEAYAWAGRPADAVTAARAGLRQLEGLDDVLWTAPLVAHGLRAAADLAEGARAHRSASALEAASAGLDTLRGELVRLGARVTADSGRGWVAIGRGELDRAGGGAGPGPGSGDRLTAWREAIAAFDSVPDPLDAAYARFRAAEAALRAEGVRADVADLVREAAAVADAAGAAPLAAAVSTLAARARIEIPARLDPASADGRAAVTTREATASHAAAADTADPRAAARALGLSVREIEVLELVAAGMSNGEIAERLFITRKTASVHVTHILDKLGVDNRVGAAMIAARVGLTAHDAPRDSEPEARR